MRRVVGIVTSAAFAATLCSGVVRAAGSPLAAGRVDLRSALMMRLFGETSDSRAAFAATQGDRTSESPLRELALQVSAPTTAFTDQIATIAFAPPRGEANAALAGVSNLDRAFDAGVMHDDAAFAASRSSGDAVTLAPSALLTAAYQPVEPVPAISPEPGTLAFDGAPASSQSASFVPLTTKVGGVQFEGRVGGSSSENPALLLHDNTGAAGADFQVRAGKRDINLNLSTQYEHLTRNDTNNFSVALGSTTAWQLPGADTPLAIPSYADLNRVSLGAGVAVPVVPGLTLNLNYGLQHQYGGYGMPGLLNLDSVNNTYGGKLTFNIPDASKTLSISAYQERFNDSLLPLNGSTQTREDVNFTVKF